MRANPAAGGGGVIVSERDGVGIARIAARSGQAARISEILRAQWGVEPPDGPRRASLGGIGVGGIGPGVWLATSDDGGNGFAESLRPLLADCAAVSDQSDAYVILSVSGPKVRETLAKLMPIDVHARAFEAGHLAQTVCGYVNVILWRLADAAQGPVFEIWVGRSLAVSVHQAICESAAEFGFVRQNA